MEIDKSQFKTPKDIEDFFDKLPSPKSFFFDWLHEVGLIDLWGKLLDENPNHFYHDEIRKKY